MEQIFAKRTQFLFAITATYVFCNESSAIPPQQQPPEFAH
jgi:hypothetical protein